MHVETGKLISEAEYASLDELSKREFVHLASTPQEAKERLLTLDAPRKGWMKNKPCPCGSGRKFKKCHWHKQTVAA